ncbi:hypothetical protein SSUA7_1671 [Streptococcus suis A7]|nr:hypothetical protein SSUA7_1671 [Streptococcus suis A7]
MEVGDRAKQVHFNSCRQLVQSSDCARLEIALAEQVTPEEYGKANSNNPVECLNLEIRKRNFLLRRSNKRKTE